MAYTGARMFEIEENFLLDKIGEIKYEEIFTFLEEIAMCKMIDKIKNQMT